MMKKYWYMIHKRGHTELYKNYTSSKERIILHKTNKYFKNFNYDSTFQQSIIDLLIKKETQNDLFSLFQYFMVDLLELHKAGKNLIFKGYYATCLMSLRKIYELYLLLNYIIIHPDKFEKFLEFTKIDYRAVSLLDRDELDKQGIGNYAKLRNEFSPYKLRMACKDKKVRKVYAFLSKFVHTTAISLGSNSYSHKKSIDYKLAKFCISSLMYLTHKTIMLANNISTILKEDYRLKDYENESKKFEKIYFSYLQF